MTDILEGVFGKEFVEETESGNKKHAEEKLGRVLRSSNFANIYNVWAEDDIFRNYAKKNLPEIHKACEVVHEAKMKLIETVGQHFHYNAGGLEP